MLSCSECVSPGHPDKTADGIASCILDAYIKHDKKTRFALEVQIKDQVCNLAGEITSTWKPTNEEIENLVRDAIRRIGYDEEYAAKWPDGATLNAGKVKVNNFIGQQSPDIAQGVDRDGWGDQGVFCGMAVNKPGQDYLPLDVHLAKDIMKAVYLAALSGEVVQLGLDIKTLVSIGENDDVEQIIVAVPMLPCDEDNGKMYVRSLVEGVLVENGKKCDNIIINGTGAYVVHSSVGDAGVVGRKLAVDFYGLNCPIGGGSPWGKDATKSDVTLNLAARYFSLKTLLEGKGKYDKVFTKISCCIGKNECLLVQTDGNGAIIKKENIVLSPSEYIAKFGLDGSMNDFMFFSLNHHGLFMSADNAAIIETF